VSQCRVAPTSTVTEVGQNNPKGLLESADKREKSNYGKRAVERTVWTRPGEVSLCRTYSVSKARMEVCMVFESLNTRGNTSVFEKVRKSTFRSSLSMQ